MTEYGKFVNFCRKAVRVFGPKYQLCLPAQAPPEGSLFICRHLNMRGPLATLAWLPYHPRPWILAVLCQKESAYAHYCGYTFTQRYGWPLPLAKLLARPLAAFMGKITGDLGAIPVHRDRESFKTVSQSLKALAEKDSLILYPDVAYDQQGETGELYRGFLLLEKFFYARQGRHVPFVPIRLQDNTITVQSPVYFDDWQDEEQFAAALEKALQEIRRLL